MRSEQQSPQLVRDPFQLMQRDPFQQNGVLSVVVPKKAGTATQRRKIQIGSGSRS